MQIFRNSLILFLALSSSCHAQGQLENLERLGIALVAPRYEQITTLCANGALNQSQAAAVSALLARIAVPGLKDSLDYSPAYYAVMADNIPELKRLLALGYDTSMPDGTLLGAAAFWNSTKSARYLLDQGMDPNSTTSGGGTPLMVAVSEGGPDVARLLLASGAHVDMRTLRGAIVCRDQAMVDSIVHAGAPIDAKTRKVASKFDMHLPSIGR